MNNKNTVVFKQNVLIKVYLSGFLIAVFLFACNAPAPVENKAKEVETKSFVKTPANVVHAIKSKFPNAVPYSEEIDSLLKHLRKFGIYPKSMLWGQSICVDDITNTKNKLLLEIKGPFNIGGLAGLPFTGITGLDAFVHHVPDDGTAILFVGPHIGYNEKEGWGKILRHEQHHTSTCCGALTAAYSKRQKGELKKKMPIPDDYQQGMIEQFIYDHHEEIDSSSDPLITLTKLTYHEAIKQLTYHVTQLKEKHFKYLVVLGVVIINTDFMYSDYLSIETIAIRDLQKNEWIEGTKPR